MTFSKKRCFISIFLVLTAMIGMFLLPFQAMKTSAAEDYHKWRQTDSRWGSVCLGNANHTMAKEGCLVTAVAILAVHSGTKDPETFNPGTFAESLNAVNAFSDGAIASWAKVTEVIPEIKLVDAYYFQSSTQSGKAAEMKQFMDQGYYMTCNVGGHWVFIQAINGDNVSMIDPAKDSTDLFASYSLYNISELRVFTGKYPAQNNMSEPATPAPTTEKWKKGEYYASDSEVTIFSSADQSTVFETLNPGYIVKVIDVNGDMGCIQLGNDKGWIDLNKLVYAGASVTQERGDINNDKSIDTLDLELLNEYISSLSEVPDGISLLRECEIEAADINGDGVVDNNDVLQYLAIVCE
jgi:hypothetical protein